MKILVIQHKMIGDVLTATVLFPMLRNRFPNAELHYLINEGTEAVVQNNPNIDRIILCSKKKQKSVSGFLTLIRKVRNEKYGIVIDAYAKPSSGLMCLLSGAGKRISFSKGYSQFFHTHSMAREDEPKTLAGLAIENRVRLLSPLMGIPETFPKPKIYLAAEELKDASSFLKGHGINPDKPFCMVSILGSSPQKTYPLEYMAKVIETIASRSDSELLFNYIPHQIEMVDSLFGRIPEPIQKRIHLNCYAPNLRMFLGITNYCDALIGNEGGAINMAKALEVPTFSIVAPFLRKERWSLFEDDMNRSVHLSDYHPEILEKSPKKIKGQVEDYYQMFKPELFRKELVSFVDLALKS